MGGDQGAGSDSEAEGTGVSASTFSTTQLYGVTANVIQTKLNQKAFTESIEVAFSKLDPRESVSGRPSAFETPLKGGEGSETDMPISSSKSNPAGSDDNDVVDAGAL